MKLRNLILAAGATLSASAAIAQDAVVETMDKGDVAFMIFSTVMVLFMIIPGVALFYGGLVRTKNMLSILTQTTMITALVMVIWVFYGYSFAFGGGTSPWWGGTDKLFLAGVTMDSMAATFTDGVVIPEYVFIAFQMTFAAITPALIIGGFAERIKFKAVMIFTLLWVTFAYFPIAHMVWDGAGYIFNLGALDFAYPEALKHIASRRKIEQWQQKGYQIVAFKGATSQSTALFAFSNPARQGAKQMIDDVRHMGVKDVVIASGDHHENVERLAGLLGVDQFFARLRPADKLELVKKRKRAGQCVLMVGDGMNDAPTLAAADVSISLASGTDLAKVNCDFVLLGDDISKVTQLINIARDTQKIIRQNIYWAVGYNLFAVPFAVAGFIQPWMAALGMSMSALLVVSNALRLSRTEPDPSHTAGLIQDNEAVDAPAMGAH